MKQNKITKKFLLYLLLVILVVIQVGCGNKIEKNEKSVAINKENLKWWQNTLVYEIYPNSFKDSDGDGYGDIKGITSELDYLKDLGVGAIWLTPIYESPMGDNGYDVSDYYNINPRFGTMEDVDELISEAKKRDIKLVMDLVFNHTSKECNWFKESSQNRDNEKKDWYIWADPAEDGGAPNNWRSIFGGSAWTYSPARGQYFLHTFADFQPDVNWENPNVRNALYDIANFWADKGVGGFRVDAVTYIKKPSSFDNGPVDDVDNLTSIHKMTANTDGILDFLHEFKDKVEKGRDIFMVGEANGVPSTQLSSWVGDNGVFDMIFEFSHVNVQFAEGEIWSKTKDWKLTDLKKAFVNSQTSTKDNGWYPIFLENHDQPRSINHFLPEGADADKGSKLLGMMLTTQRGTPFIYQGEEIGMSNIDWNDINSYNDISSHNQYKTALANGLSQNEAIKCVQKYSRDNARTPMQWSDEINAGFTTGTPWLSVNNNYKKINVKMEKDDKESVLKWYYKLSELRKSHNALINGSFEELKEFEDSEEIFAYSRENDDEKVVVLLNFTGKTIDYKLNNDKTTILLSNYENSQSGKLQPYEAICLKIN